MHEILKGQTITNDNALIVVSAKEEGKLYELRDGALHFLQHVTEHPPAYSDNEGFFQRSGNGMTMGSGSVLEESDEHNFKQFLNTMSEAVREQTDAIKPRAVLILEPEHLKHKLAERTTQGQPASTASVLFGNFVHESPKELYARLEKVYATDGEAADPGDPDSVAGEKDEAEKRSILNVPVQN